MKKLPIGKQDLPKLINEDCIYVDKTEIIHRLISTGSTYFLSRPRRFGKSLTVSTLKEIFSGNKELFKGLWIYEKIDWKKYPIIHIDFSEITKKSVPVIDGIHFILDEIASQNRISLLQKDYSFKFRELIQALSKTGQVVILIDEYDKPIIDYIDDIPQAEKNREILKNFYSVLKGSDKYIKFLFITGVSKFSKVSIFSDLNHLDDITLNENYGCLVGYTEQELETYFPEYLKLANDKLSKYFTNVKQEIKNKYNGYSWNGVAYVYNPFSLLGFFTNIKFENYWFETGTPTFLVKLIKERNYNISEFESTLVKKEIFDKYELSNLELIALMFQTGYLTVKGYDYRNSQYTLSYPNNEVRGAFETMLLSEISCKSLSENASLLNDITAALKNNDIEKFIQLLKILFKNITYPIIDNRENYYHSIFYLVIKMLGFDIAAEVLTNDGRIDAVIKCANCIYIIEFKIGTAKSALEQIHKKQYHLKLQNEKKQIVLLGIGFSTKAKNVKEFLVEEL